MIASPTAEPSIATDAERQLLASMLYDPESVKAVVRRVQADDFGDFAHRAVFRAIAKVHFGGSEVDAALVLPLIKGDAAIDDPHLLMADIADSVATGAHVMIFAEQVEDQARKRRIIDAAETALRAASNGQSGAEVLTDLLSFAEDESKSTERRGAVESFTIGELVQKHPRLNPPVVDGLFREGETCNIIAASKVGKSWLAYGLALAIINNERWLGRFDVSPGKVLLIDNELHRETLASRIPAVAEAMGIPLETIERDLVVWPLRGNLRSLQELSGEFDQIEPGEYKAIILDAKYRFAAEGVSENDNSAETLVYNLLDQYAAKTKAAFVLIHHASKGDQSGKAVTDVGSGAGAQSRATDCHLVIRPHEEEGCAVLDAAVRSFAPVDPVTIRWAFPVWITDDRLDPAKLAGRLGKGQQAKASEDQADKAQVLEKLTEAGEPLSLKKIRQATGFGKDKAERLVFALMADGAVSDGEGVVGHNKCTVYQINEPEGGMGGTGVVGPPCESVPGGEGGAAPKGGPTTPPHQPGTPFPEFEQFEEVG